MSKKRKNKVQKGSNRAQKVAKRKEKKPEVKAPTAPKGPAIKMAQIPHIIGGQFRESFNNIDDLQKKIDALPKSDYKRRILFISEASYLRTEKTGQDRQI